MLPAGKAQAPEWRMKTRLILKPGQRGTKNRVEKYGDPPSVRYRYDAVLRQRFKTVELIVEKTAWIPPAPRFSLDVLIPLHIEAFDMRKWSMAKAAGGDGTVRNDSGSGGRFTRWQRNRL